MDPPGAHLSAALSVTPERAQRAFRAEIAYYLEHHVEGRDEATLDALRARCAAVLRDALGEPAPDLAVVRAAMLNSIRFTAFPDAGPALRELRALGARLVVASNWDYTLPAVLERVGLRELVDGVVTSAEVGAAKPDRRFFEAALRAAGCRADDAVYVGDSPTNDYAGARAAGLRAVLVRRDAAAGDGESVARLTELPALLFDG
jgi:putative hydrolase of the HAD superfamily